MGIPGFASRIRARGTNLPIGQKGTDRSQSQLTIAIIDGPALAHFLFQSSQSGVHANSGIGPQFNYKSLGKAAIAWIDMVRTKLA